MQKPDRLAVGLKRMLGKAEALEKEVDDFKYRNGLTEKVGRDVADSINALSAAKIALRDATMKQAFDELEVVDAGS